MRGALERGVLTVLWSAERALSARDVLETINHTREIPLAYTTVVTVLTRLTEKGALCRRRAGRSFVYTATAVDEAALAVRAVLARHGMLAVRHFVDQIGADRDLPVRLHMSAKQPDVTGAG